MCGIAGFLNADNQPASPVILERMGNMIAHRGPDGSGHYTDGPLGLAHRRLAIIDLSSAGHQPMMSRCGRYVMTYNGETYNYRELRIELEAEGVMFRSRTDSEIVLEGFARWGWKVLDRLNGMFAFAIWDCKRRILCLARDRYGVKPLYYANTAEGFIFGSEVKAFLPHRAFTVKMDRKALLEYMTFQNFFTNRTLFDGVRMLPAGHRMEVSLDKPGAPVSTRYWDYSFVEPDAPRSEDEYLEELEHLIRQAVTRQLVSDAPLGSYLSGGLDSGAISGIAAKQIPGMCTFTVGYDMSSVSGLELQFDERARAERMSYLYGTEQYEMVLKAGDMERCMADLVWHLEEPRVGQSYPNYYAARLASKFCKVIMAGTGGDELFGGYPWRYYRAVVNDDFESYIDKYYVYWQRLIRNRDIKKAFAPIWDSVSDVWTRDIFRNVFHHHAPHLTRPEDYLKHSLYFEAKTFLHGLLVVEDKLSMAHGLECRVPFLDNDLVDFAGALPVNLKVRRLDEVVRVNENELYKKNPDVFQKSSDGKYLMRKALRHLIPEDINQAAKQGFSAPDATWFRGDSIDFVKDTLLNENAAVYEYLDYDHITSLIGEHVNGQENRRLLIWSVLYLEEWCRKFISGRDFVRNTGVV